MPRKYRKKRRYSKRGKSAKSVAYTALKKVNKIEAQIEKKHLDVRAVDNVIDTASYAGCLNPLTLGDFGDSREGDKVTNVRLRINAILENKHGTPTDTLVRLVVLRFKDQEGASTVSWNDVYQSIVQGGTGYGGPLAHRYVDSRNKYAIIYDNTFFMDTALNSGIPLKLSFKFNHQTQYKKDPTGGGTPTDIVRNGLWILAISDQATSINAPYLSYFSRLTYTDM